MRTWPHSPARRATAQGATIITAATLNHSMIFDTRQKLDMLRTHIFEAAMDAGWELEAWAIFPNHYHVVGIAPDRPSATKTLTSRIHTLSARDANVLDGSAGRKVWFQYYDTRLTYDRSYLARLAYVHSNPVHHGVVRSAEDYEWCSMRWLLNNADAAWHQTVLSFKVDRVNVREVDFSSEWSLQE